MDKELALRTFGYLIGHYKTHDETIINSQEIEAIEFILKNNKDLEQQCKKQKEVIDRIFNETKETRNILNNNRDDNLLSKSCLLSYLEIVEDLLKEVSE